MPETTSHLLYEPADRQTGAALQKKEGNPAYKGIAVVGLGYVGLPIASAFDSAGYSVIGFDIDPLRIKELLSFHDSTCELDKKTLQNMKAQFTTDPSLLKKAGFIIVTVPTPIDKANHPDLSLLKSASKIIGENLSPGSIVVFESTVYPGVTEEICLPILESASGLKAGVDFKVGYSPERINPGDKEHTLDKVIKVVSGMDEQSLELIAEVYGSICKKGVWKAPSIKVAEAAKVIENIQRDLNIGLMNELAVLFGKLGINTRDVLAASATKWNFHSYTPGLVGGHCIGVDPYYLTYLAETIGLHSQIILAGRRTNDQMPHHIAHQVILGLVKAGKVVNKSRALILGAAFKENVPDTRNSKVFHLVKELKKYGVETHVCDPFIEHEKILSLFNAKPVQWPLDGIRYDAVVAAVCHDQFKTLPAQRIEALLNPPGVVMDVKWLYRKEDFSPSVIYESL